LASSSSCHCRTIPAGAATRTKSTRRRRSISRRNETCLHCHAGADIVGDQRVDPRKTQCLAQRQKLVSILMDACPEGGLEQVSVGSGRSIPAKRAQVGGENARVVGSEPRDTRPPFVLQNRPVEFCVPQDLDHFTLSVIVHAGQAQRRQALTGGALVLHQPTPSSDAHKITALRHCSHSHPPRTVATWSSPKLALVATAPAWPEHGPGWLPRNPRDGDVTCGILWPYASGTSPPGVVSDRLGTPRPAVPQWSREKLDQGDEPGESGCATHYPRKEPRSCCTGVGRVKP
jgi:hypothetical protein